MQRRRLVFAPARRGVNVIELVILASIAGLTVLFITRLIGS